MAAESLSSFSSSTNDSSIIERFWQTVSSPAAYTGLSMTISLSGFVSNVVNLVVVSRPRMLKNPTNIVLCGLSSAQLFLVVSFFSYTIFRHAIDPGSSKSFGWLVAFAGNVYFIIVSHGLVMTFSVFLMFYRLLTLLQGSSSMWMMRVTRRSFVKKVVIGSVIVLSPILIIPFAFNTTIRPSSSSSSLSSPFEITNDSTINTTDGSLSTTEETIVAFQLSFQSPGLTKVNFVLYALIWKLLPTLAILVLISVLIHKMSQAIKSRNQLSHATTVPAAASAAAGCRQAATLRVPSPVETPSAVTVCVVISENDCSSQRQISSQNSISPPSIVPSSFCPPSTDHHRQQAAAASRPQYANLQNNSGAQRREKKLLRSTVMLVMIALMMLFVELPQCGMTLDAAVRSDNDHREVYEPFHAVFELPTILYSSINLILYSATSSLFRRTFSQIFFKRTPTVNHL